MPALPDTIQHERVGRGPMAIPVTAPSFHDHRQGGAACSASRRLRHGRVGPYQFRKLGRSLHHRLFSHWSRYLSSLAVTNRGVSAQAFPRVHYHYHDLTGANRSVVYSATRQHFSQAVADVVHLSRLSYSPSFDGSKKPWKWRQELGKVIQGRGHFVQGGGRCD